MTTTFIQPGPVHRENRPLSPVPHARELTVVPGPALLAGIERGPSLAAHRALHGPLPSLDRATLLSDLERIRLIAPDLAAALGLASAPSSEPEPAFV